MKLHFEPNLDYQHAAIESVCDLFRGQEVCRAEFTVTRAVGSYRRLAFAESDLGVGNRLELLDDEILENLKEIQLRTGLRPSDSLRSGDFTVEMETGTGKTYVYLRTIFELNKRFGFTKFVIVVPSVAIKEGVYKTLQLTEEHFRGLYANAPFEYFLYDSTKLGQVRNYATSPHIQIMVVTVGAINKQDVNNLYKESEKTDDHKPIDLIKATRPVLIVDEPQTVDGGLQGRGKEALGAMNPLCTLRYSATHVDRHHMVFRLDAVDAYERKLVKQIEVASATVEGGYNRPYVRFIAPVTRGKSVVGARVELDVQTPSGVRRKEVTVGPLDHLEQTTGREIYRNHIVGQEIRAKKGSELMELRYPGGEVYLQRDQAHGDVDTQAVQREMIRRTIREHLDKEKRLRPQGIKVLSLFFVKAVEDYRTYDDAGNPLKGGLALTFEEEYRRAARLPEYRTLFNDVDLTSTAEEVHDGYFSIDKKGKWIEPDVDKEGELKNQASRDNAERAYNLIMKDKERLLSFETKLKFIFSHSALKEGWDNPNVFQICSFREMRKERERRQTIGRGLRLCVNQEGERVRGFDVNTLTVIATESYEEFAENLQKDITRETGIHFGVVEKHQFAAIPVEDEQGRAKPLGVEQSEAIWAHLKQSGMLDTKGNVQDALRQALKENSLELPATFDAVGGHVREILAKFAGKLEVKNADERKQVRTRRAVLKSEEFKALWDRIKHKTTYRVHFDNEELIRKCIQAINHAPAIIRTRLQWRKADLAIGKAGVEAMETAESAPVVIEEGDLELPDLLTDLQDRTQLTRRSLARILTECDRLDDFKKNPQQFIDQSADAINRAKRFALVDGIKYQRIGDEHFYAQELFEQEELTGYLKNMIAAEKSVHEYVIYDSGGVERSFAEQLERNEAVKVYAKLPGWFTVPTPLGTYNPDWAVLVERDGADRLYLVVETKSSLFADDLHAKEGAKIRCGEVHFKAIALGENPAKYMVATKVDDLF